MTITKATVTERLMELQRQMKGLDDQMNAVSGAMQECQFWLKTLDEPEPPQAAKAEAK